MNELHLYYQPLVALHSCELLGFEALLRREHPERGLLEPAQFLDAAEAAAGDAIDQWVIGSACRHAAAWACPPAGQTPPLLVSVNLSQRRLAHPGAVRPVARALRATGVDPRRVLLEVPAGAPALGRVADANLRDLRSLGVGLAVDGIGATSSNIGDLAARGIGIAKIERSLVAGLGRGAADEVLGSIVRMSHLHGIRVAAVGVETSLQVSTLRSLRCDVAQGFYFARPQPRDVIDALVHIPLRWRGTEHHPDVA
jgi:EAL domain-containing protein (putative c-di-GMP-specific phosphodiesterase class I)